MLQNINLVQFFLICFKLEDFFFFGYLIKKNPLNVKFFFKSISFFFLIYLFMVVLGLRFCARAFF